MTMLGLRHGIVPGKTLNIAYEEYGPAHGASVVLLHGFPYDVRCYDRVAPVLAEAGLRVIVPYLRGYGPTEFLHATTPRSGEQAALAHDLLELVDHLALDRPLLCGFDWGGRAACAASVLFPDRFSGLLAIGGYSIYDIATALDPAPPAVEYVMWYQYYFHSERGARGLKQDRRGLCRLLWSLWSPGKQFDEAAFARTAPSFDNPDFVAVVLSSYRHRFGLAAGDPAFASFQQKLATLPPVNLPTAVLHGTGGPLPPPSQDGREKFPDLLWSRTVEGAGHNVPHEAPEAVTKAILELVHEVGAYA